MSSSGIQLIHYLVRTSLNMNYNSFNIQCLFKHFWGFLFNYKIFKYDKYKFYLNCHHWFYLHSILCIQLKYYTNGSIKTERITNKHFWGGTQLCYLNVLPQIWWWTFDVRRLPDECHNWSRPVCLMHENNDYWFSQQTRMIELRFTILNVHKIKYKCTVLFKIKWNCKE